MSWEAFLPSNVARNPSGFVGPNVAGAIVQAIETGILFNQSVRFWSRAADETRLIRSMVVFVSVAALFQTAIAFYDTWRVVVLGFGNWLTVVNLKWPDRIQPVLNSAMAAPFQAFLIWRCWNALRRPWFLLIFLSSLLIATVGANIFITADVFRFSLATVVNIKNGTPPRDYITAFVLTAVLDICITTSMLYVLIRARSQIITRSFDKILGRLLIMLWESALPPAACAIAACAVYITMSLDNMWDLFLQSILGKLYVISFFVTLNGRADLKHIRSANSGHDGSPGLSRHWLSGAEVRVHLTTIVDNNDESDLGHSDIALTPSSASSGTRPFTSPQGVVHLSVENKSEAATKVDTEENGIVLTELRKMEERRVDGDLEMGLAEQPGPTGVNIDPRRMQTEEHANIDSRARTVGLSRPQGRPP